VPGHDEKLTFFKSVGTSLKKLAAFPVIPWLDPLRIAASATPVPEH
jgi:hypothetical protein